MCLCGCKISSRQASSAGSACLLSVLWPSYCIAMEISSSLSPSCITAPLPRRVRAGREALGGPCKLEEDDEGKGATLALTLPVVPCCGNTCDNTTTSDDLRKDTKEEAGEAVRAVEGEMKDNRGKKSTTINAGRFNAAAKSQCQHK